MSASDFSVFQCFIIELAMKKEVNDLMEQLVSEKKQFLKQKKEKIFKKGGDRENQVFEFFYKLKCLGQKLFHTLVQNRCCGWKKSE